MSVSNMLEEITIQVQVGISGDSGEPLQLVVPCTAAIEHVRSCLAELTHTPVCYQQLTKAVDGAVLEDGQSIADSGLVTTKSVVMVRTLPDKNTLRPCCFSDDELSEQTIEERVELVRYILQHGEDDPNKLDEKGTVLHGATNIGSLEMCKLLLEDCRFNAVNARCSMEVCRCYANPLYEDTTALHLAAATDKGDICKLLLEDKRVDVNAKSREGYTALHFAVAQRALESCKALLQHHEYDVNAVDNVGMSALEVAVACCMPESEQVLVTTFAPGDTGMKLTWGTWWLEVTEVTPQGQAESKGVEVGMELKIVDGRPVNPGSFQKLDELKAGQRHYPLEFHLNEKYRLHALTEDGGCWFSSKRLECRENAEKVCELLAQNERFKMNAKLQAQFNYAKNALISDRHWVTRTLSVTARYSSGIIACSFDISVEETTKALIEQAKNQAKEQADCNRSSDMMDCIGFDGKVLWGRSCKLSELFDRGSHGKPFGRDSLCDSIGNNTGNLSSSCDIRLLTQDDFCVCASDGSWQAELKVFDEDQYYEEFKRCGDDEYDYADCNYLIPMLYITHPPSAKCLHQCTVPLEIFKVAASISLSEGEDHLLFETVTDNVFSYSVKEKTFLRGAGMDCEYIERPDVHGTTPPDSE